MARGVQVDFTANVARFTSGIDKATNDLARFQSNSDRISKQIDASLANIGVGLSAAGFITFTKSVIDGMDKLNDLSKTTGIAVGTLSGLGVAAKQSGADLESIAASVNKLAVNMGKDGEKFKALGITVKDPLEAFKQLADVFVSIKDPQERAAVAAEALGKSWAGAAPLLAEGGAAIGRMVSDGEKASGVTKDMAEQADKFNDQLELMKAKIAGVTVSITGGMLPAINSLLDKVKSASASGGLFGFFTSTNAEEANAQASIDSLKTKVQSLQKMRDELTAPTFANKLNNTLLGSLLSGGTSDIKTIDNQIAAAQSKIAYLQQLVKTASQVEQAPTPKAPSNSAINAFLGNDSASKAAAEAARKAAQELANLQKEGKNLSESVDPMIKLSDELERYTTLLEKGAINQDIFDKAAAKAIGDADSSLNKAAVEAQRAFEALQKEGKNLAESVDPMVKRNAELERYLMLLDKGFISQETFDKAATKSINDAETSLKGKVDDMSSILIGFQTNIQSTLGTGLYNMMDGNFKNIGASFEDMLKRMLATALAARLDKAIFGADGGASLLNGGISMLTSIFSGIGGLGGAGKAVTGASVLTEGAGLMGFAAKGAYFDNSAHFALGGVVNRPTPFQFASGGAFMPGLMGEAGPEAIMPLKRDSSGRLGVSGGTGQGVVIHNNPTIYVDSRSDRASVIQDMKKMIQYGNAELVQTLERQRRI